MADLPPQIDDPNYVPPPPPPPIGITDLLNSVQVIAQKEADDKILLEGISTIPFDTLRTKLISWAVAGFPNVYEIHQISISPPTICSDGVARTLADYIVFCSGKSISEHVAGLQEKVADIVVSFANMGSYISIVVSKA